MPVPLKPELCCCRKVRRRWIRSSSVQLLFSVQAPPIQLLHHGEGNTMLLALRHFEVYVGSSPSRVIVYTVHNPLVFHSQMYNHKQRFTCVGPYWCRDFFVVAAVFWISLNFVASYQTLFLFLRQASLLLFKSRLHHCYSPHFPWTTLGTKQGKIGFIRAWSWSAVHLNLYECTARTYLVQHSAFDNFVLKSAI